MVILLTNLNYILQPKRLYLVVTEKPIVIPQWSGRFERVNFPEDYYFYRMENEKEWPLREAYAWFLFMQGAKSGQADNPKVGIFDAEEERSLIDTMSAGQNLAKPGQEVFTAIAGSMQEGAQGIGDVFGLFGSILKYAKWILIGGGVLVGGYYAWKYWPMLTRRPRTARVTGVGSMRCLSGKRRRKKG